MTNKLRSLTILATVILLVALVGCPGKPGNPTGQTSSSQPESVSQSTTEAESITRVVSMAPNLTQIMYAINESELLVGVDEYSVYPPAAKSLPKMGNYLNPNLESITAARPDLVLVLNNDEQTRQMLSGAGLKTESFKDDRVSEVLESIERMGNLFNATRTAGWVLQSFEGRRTMLESIFSSKPRVTVALVVGRNPGRLQDIYIASSSSFMGELLSIAGGDNVFENKDLPWPQVGIESIVSADPDVIIDSTLSKGATDAEYNALLHDWDTVPTLKAVKNKRIIVPRDGWWQIPGAFMDSTLMLFAHWLHPDLFPTEVPDPNLAFPENGK